MKDLFEMDLQLFAEGEGAAGEGTEQTSTSQEGDKAKEAYTHEEVKELLQKETDRRVTEALKKQERKLESKLKEADKLRNMDEEQKRQYEFEQREKALEEKEREFSLMENKIECNKILNERGLPIDFVGYVVAEDADTMMENINSFEKAFKAAVADAVNNKLQKKTPSGGTTSQKGMTKESFRKLSLAEQSEIYRTNPSLYKELVGEQ